MLHYLVPVVRVLIIVIINELVVKFAIGAHMNELGVDKFLLINPCSQAITYQPAFFNSNWGHSTSMLHTSGSLPQSFIHLEPSELG